MHWKINYQPPTLWKGRIDSAIPERLHQSVITIDLTKTLPEPNAIVFCGFASDIGITRNQGRPGAKLGPKALRQALASLPFSSDVKVVDVGDIVSDDDDLESAQLALAEMIALLYQNKNQVIVFGGGHAIAWGHYQGIAKAFHDIDLGIINFDAHYDLRPLLPDNKGSSGTPFLQIALAAGKKFSYTCIGIQPLGNTKHLFEKARELNVNTVFAESVDQEGLAQVEKILRQHHAIYLTLCLDVFAQAFAPGVSAPQPLGLTPQQVLPLLKRIAKHSGPVFFDVAELSPPLDRDDMTAKLAAVCVMGFLMARVDRGIL